MLWLKRCVRCVMPRLSYEVIVADVIYPAVLLAFGRNITLLPAMVGCIQSGLRVLIKMFCKIEALMDDEGNVLVDQNDDPELKVPNPRAELPYPTWWHGILCIVHPR